MGDLNIFLIKKIIYLFVRKSSCNNYMTFFVTPSESLHFSTKVPAMCLVVVKLAL